MSTAATVNPPVTTGVILPILRMCMVILNSKYVGHKSMIKLTFKHYTISLHKLSWQNKS
jgi:hypothetical protein